MLFRINNSLVKAINTRHAALKYLRFESKPILSIDNLGKIEYCQEYTDKIKGIHYDTYR